MVVDGKFISDRCGRGESRGREIACADQRDAVGARRVGAPVRGEWEDGRPVLQGTRARRDDVRGVAQAGARAGERGARELHRGATSAGGGGARRECHAAHRGDEPSGQRHVAGGRRRHRHGLARATGNGAARLSHVIIDSANTP